MTDPLDEINEFSVEGIKLIIGDSPFADGLHGDQIRWLIGEVERLSDEVERLERYRSLGQIPRLDLLLEERDQARAEVKRLREQLAEEDAAEAVAERRLELLGRLEWAGGMYSKIAGGPVNICPVCHQWRTLATHRADCELAAAIRPTSPDPSEGSQP
jgi:hypothetical protein